MQILPNADYSITARLKLKQVKLESSIIEPALSDGKVLHGDDSDAKEYARQKNLRQGGIRPELNYVALSLHGVTQLQHTTL